MNIKFDPNNNVVKLCMIGMSLEDDGKFLSLKRIFKNYW